MITKFVRGVDILKLTRYSGENQVQCDLFSIVIMLYSYTCTDSCLYI